MPNRPDPLPPTDAQIRDAIDSGATGEKIGWDDPAAAPLGTDAEAGGNATAPSARAQDARAVAPDRTPDSRHRSGMRGFAIFAVAAGALAAIIVFAVAFA